jgi:uncharacterized protein (TIGR01619 family)
MSNAYQPDWDLYTCHIDDHPAIIGLDLDLRRFAPLNSKPHAIYVSVYLNAPRADGFPQGDEFQVLGEIEDSLVKGLETNLNAHFVGRTVSNGIRDFYFYANETLLYDKYIADAMVNFPTYQYDYVVKEDRSWGLYFDFLLPDKKEFQRIQNRKVIRTLKQHGDLEEKPRQIDHYIYFATEADRELYWQKISKENFVVQQRSLSGVEERPYSLHVSRVDRTDETSINTVVLFLWELASLLNADYNGWETVVVPS